MLTVDELIVEDTRLKKHYKVVKVARKEANAQLCAAKQAITDFEAKKAIALLEIQLKKEKAKLAPVS